MIKGIDQLFIKALTLINTDFDSLESCSIQSIDSDYGELNFLWAANKSQITLSMSTTCWNCICDDPDDVVSCDCDWIAFKEDCSQIRKSFTKKQYYQNKTQTTLNI